MPHDVIMPALGMAQDSGVLVRWIKQAGEAVAEGDALFEVETDKATMEVEAQAAGFLTNVTASEGQDVPVGQVIALISETAEGSTDAPATAAPSADAYQVATKVPFKSNAGMRGIPAIWIPPLKSCTNGISDI